MAVKMGYSRTIKPKNTTPKKVYTHSVSYHVALDGTITKHVHRSLKNVTTG